MKTIEEEEEAVRKICEQIGYGRTMQLCEQLWREKLSETGHEGGEHSTGPCVSMLVPCPCPTFGLDANGHCDWCCGSMRVTKRVLQAIDEAATF